MTAIVQTPWDLHEPGARWGSPGTPTVRFMTSPWSGTVVNGSHTWLSEFASF
ncbi:MAG: hypothetical protein WA323_27475 [Candidatus Nitrosopolaris sp.]